MRAAQDTDAVILGAGCTSALGRDLAATFAALDEGRSALQPAEATAVDPTSREVARIDRPFLRMDVPREMEPQIKFLNGSGELAVEVCAEAIRASGLLDAGLKPERRGLYLSQMDSDDWMCGEFDAAIRAATDDFAKPLEEEAFNRAAARRVKPFFMLESLKNNAFSFLATMFELRGANTSVAGFAGPTQLTLDMAVRSLARGSLDAAVVVGAARPTSTAALAEMALQDVPQPPGDGAAALVLRRCGDATDGVAVLGLGTATHTATGRHPSIEAITAAARSAVAEAQAQPGEMRGILAPGLGEEGLAEALADVPALAGVALTSYTHLWGHCALAAETMQVALAVKALEERRLPGGEPWAGDGALLVLGAGLLGQASAVVLGPV